MNRITHPNLSVTQPSVARVPVNINFYFAVYFSCLSDFEMCSVVEFFAPYVLSSHNVNTFASDSREAGTVSKPESVRKLALRPQTPTLLPGWGSVRDACPLRAPADVRDGAVAC